MNKKEIEVTKIKNDERQLEQDVVLVETPIDIHVNSKPVVNIICLAKDLKELTIGFLYSIGLIDGIEDVLEIVVKEDENLISVSLDKEISLSELSIEPSNRIIETTCGLPNAWRNSILKALEVKKSPRNDIEVTSDSIASMIKQLQKGTELFRETGGCHGAAVFTLEGDLLTIKEDIGRHNALDKVIGEMILKKIDLQNCVLTSTGRLTGDSVLKAVSANVPIFASISAAIHSGVKLARLNELTLIGFVRGKRMNIYSQPERIR